jgi:Family of unknown function (DUF5719)
MKNQRSLTLLAASVVILIISNLLNSAVSTSNFNEAYPSVVCPPNTPGLATAISLTSRKTMARKTGTSSLTMTPVGFTRYALAAQSAVIEAGPVTPVAWQVRTGEWAGAVPCSAPITSQWFLGATADITSKGSLNLVNSGLGPGLVDVTVFTESAKLTPRTISLKANSYQQIALPTLAPGAKAIAIHLTTRSGRINGFLVDERGKGLRALGGDLVNSTGDPTKSIQIPAIPQQAGKKSTAPHTLRLLVPGEVDARISAEIRSTDGTFAPVGIDGATIAHHKVVEIPMDITMAPGKFALHISSDQPILASVFSKASYAGKSDIVWSTAADDLSEFTLATTGISPTIVFTGRAIDVTLNLTYSNGSKKVVNISAQDIATFVAPATLQSVRFSQISVGTSGAALISSSSGYGYLPLNAGSRLTKSFVPSSNIRVLNP